jgi:chromosome partitioning protein
MIISLTGQKGGSGKTTTAISIATELKRRGLKVLLVDSDPQATALTFAEVATEAGQATPTTVAMGANMCEPDQLPALAEPYDHVVVDCPPRLGQVMRTALMVSDVSILPCGPAAAEAWALAESIDIINEAKAFKPDLKSFILLTRKTKNSVIGKQSREVLEGGGIPILKTELGYRVSYQESPAAGQGVTDYAPGTAAAKEVSALVDELLAMNSTEEVAA